MRPAARPRRLGAEEELFLLDEHGRPAPVVDEVLAGCELVEDVEGRPRVTREFFQCQVELVTSPVDDVVELGEQLREARGEVRRCAERVGVAPVAVAGPVLDAPFGPVVRSERFEQIARHYGRVARGSLICALQVHVEIADRAEGVAIVDRVRPWTALLLAISANSPFWCGADTGYASWRSQVWKLWPSAGPTELFGDVAAYDAFEAQIVAGGATLDVAMLNLEARLSARYPTIEYRVADTCTDPEDTMVVAAIVRALTETAAREWRSGRAPAPWRVDQLRVAAWRAARFGLEGDLLHPETGDAVPAAAALAALVGHVGEALADTGDLELVEHGLERLLVTGGGAARQRDVLRETGRLADVVADLRRRTGFERRVRA
jgi:carboxylate-amine ligase